ncbi:co-chaperone GroES [candidate division KSB1 bacterium]|nr:co-chaperone GroES [candidate division KSB1 bacterium]
MTGRKKKLIVIGDRVLIKPEEGAERTEVGLYLPKWAVERETVQGGKIVATGPGNPLPTPDELDDEPWKRRSIEPRYLPLQAREGDFAVFLRKSAIEIVFEGEKYLVVPQAAILVIIREEFDFEIDDLDDDLDEELPDDESL